MPSPVTAHYQPWHRTYRLAFWGLGTVVFAVVFYLGLVLASLPLTVFGGLVAVGYFIMLVRCYRRLRIDEPVVTVSEAGYHDARLGPPIPWTEVKALTRHQPGTQVHLFIDAEKPERFIARRPGLARLAKRRVANGLPLLGSNLAGLDMPGDRIVQAAQAWHEQARSA